MASIAGPRPNGPQHIGKLSDVSASRANKSSKQLSKLNKRDRAKQLTLESQSLLRNSFLIASIARKQELEALRGSRRRSALLKANGNRTILNNTMTSTSGCEELSGPSTFLARTSLAMHGKSGEKPLPPKPSLRPQQSPDRRGVVDATDFVLESFDARFPPLEPQSSHESCNDLQQSPDRESLKITPSLLSSDRSPSNSPGFVELGIAQSTSIKLLSAACHGSDSKWQTGTSANSHQINEDDHLFGGVPGNASSGQYVLNSPSSDKPAYMGPRPRTIHHSDGSPIESPARPSSIPKLVNRPNFRGSQPISARGQNFLALSNTKRQEGLQLLRPDSQTSDATTPPMVNRGVSLNSTNSLVRTPRDDGVRESMRSSKYGYNIKHTSDAHAVIMGQAMASKSDKITKGPHTRQVSPDFSKQNVGRVLEIKLATPASKGKLKQTKEDSSLKPAPVFNPSGNAKARQLRLANKQVDLIQRDVRYSEAQSVPTLFHPPRTSSLLTTASPSAEKVLNVGATVKSASAPKHASTEPIEAIMRRSAPVDMSKIPLSTPRAPRVSLFNRHTVASAARASAIDKKAAQSPSLAPRMTHSRTLSSFTDVGRGIKKFGQRVVRIIPGRRGSSTLTSPKTAQRNLMVYKHENHSQIPLQQASRLLTTYNSDMNNMSSSDLSLSTSSMGHSTEAEPADRHEPAEAANKNSWRNASQNELHDSDIRTMAIWNQIFTGQRANLGGNGGDGDEPPSPRQVPVARGEHYLEAPADDTVNASTPGVDMAATAITSDSTTGDAIHIDDTAFVDTETPDTIPTSVLSLVIGQEHSGSDVNNARPTVADVEAQLTIFDTEARNLMAYALNLEDSDFRTFMLRTATSLGEGLIRLREARIEALRMSQSIDEIMHIMATNTARMDAIIHASIRRQQ